jgi:predicted ATP-grasp superfamily ATP-dependent carboligase
MSNHIGRPLACVVGTLDLVRALGLVGISSAVVSPPGDFARYSRHTKVRIDSVDASREPHTLIERLLRFGSEQPSPPVLYYDGDFKLLAISRGRAALAQAFRFVLPEPGLAEDLVDKSRFAALVERLALPVPPAVRVSPDGNAPVTDLRFPLVIKPLTRQNDSWEPLARGKAIEVESPPELRKLWPRLREAGLGVLLQELIPGPETLVESYHAYIDVEGETAGEFTGRKIRTYPTRYGYSTALEITFEHDVVDAGREILSRLEFRGVAKLDFKRHPDDGRLYLLEVNPRFNIWHHPGAKAGVNLPEIVYRDLVGLPRRPVPRVRPGARWVHPWFDFRAARLQGIPLARWLPWMLMCEAKYGVALDDPLPIPRAAAVRLRRRLRRSAQADPPRS